MTTLCVVQARAGSTRLPGKVLADVAGRPMLGFMLQRLAGLPVDTLVLATSTEPDDDPVAAVAEGQGVAVVRGPEHDVLARFALAVDAHPADVVVRLTADCPLSDPAIISAAVALLHDHGADYASNSLVRTFPDGLDVEVLTARALREAAAEATDQREREHVTPFVYRRPSRYRLAALCNDEALGEERWTVDTAADLERIRQIVADLDDPVRAGWREVLAAAGRRVVAAPGRLRLRPVPHVDASRRSWLALRDDDEVGRATVAVDDGVGLLTWDGPTDEGDAVAALVQAALQADLQVVELRADFSS